jgi:squalene-hopene/tetraprenyl-beta-curcumene cyclase
MADSEEVGLGSEAVTDYAPTRPQDVPLAFAEAVEDAAEAAARHLLGLQASDGHWCGELEADTTLESDFILFRHFIGRLDSPRTAEAANYIRAHQLPDGGWNIHFGGPSELNATVKAYLALKLAGDSPQAPHMARARQRILTMGGIEKTNTFTRYYLCLVGACDWNMVPAVPPEMILLPNWFYLNIYEMSSWSRAILVPLSILYANKPRWPVPEWARVDELFRDPTRCTSPLSWDRKWWSWKNFFLVVDAVLKFLEQSPWKPFRKRALREAEQWLRVRTEGAEGLGAIFPAMMNSILASMALGCHRDHPWTAEQIAAFERLGIEEENTFRMQPCSSPVWDTALAVVALGEMGLPAAHVALERAAGWLLDRQCLSWGDWRIKNRDGEPGGWCFEYKNDFYPDVDDAAAVLLALKCVARPDRSEVERAVRRGVQWVLSMQGKDGGWGAFDRDNEHWVFTQVPFADHNAMLDPSTADVTARVLEMLGQYGFGRNHPAVRRGIAFLKEQQEADGSWYGRWGVNYLYGTGQALRGLAAVGEAEEAYCQQAAQWIRSIQNADGGWGETCRSYDDPEQKAIGPSTASQTAWALIGLFASGDTKSIAVQRGIRYLVETQRQDGSWREDQFTGTGFPKVFYLKYHYYRLYFPLYALARYESLQQSRPMGAKLSERGALGIRSEDFRVRRG